MAIWPYVTPQIMQFTTILQNLGLAQNEAKIYETLLRIGVSGVSAIASHANINRRNVYDSLERLLEKNIVITVIHGRDTLYQAVEPKKLLDVIHQKEQELRSVLPDMTKLFKTEASPHQVMIYYGVEGCKAYLREVLLSDTDFYAIGGKGQMLSPVIAEFSRDFIRTMNKKNVKMKVLFDATVYLQASEALIHFKEDSRILPAEFNSHSTIDIFGDKTVITSWMPNNQIDDNVSFTVITNVQLADSFRTWWHALWEISSPIV